MPTAQHWSAAAPGTARVPQLANSPTRCLFPRSGQGPNLSKRVRGIPSGTTLAAPTDDSHTPVVQGSCSSGTRGPHGRTAGNVAGAVHPRRLVLATVGTTPHAL